MNKLIIFDLDGTLTESKSAISSEMVQTISDLQDNHEVAVISGCSYAQFENQFISKFHIYNHKKHSLHLMPTCGAQLYEYAGVDGGWYQVYNNDLVLREKAKIYNVFEKAINEFGLLNNGYGEIAEDRGSQITFSMLGQNAPLQDKKEWDPDGAKRRKLIKWAEQYLKEFDIKMGGTTSIDITKKGINKSFGVLKIIEYLQVDRDDVVFIGDALFKDGNDFPIVEAGIRCIQTSGPSQTLEIIKDLQNATV